MDFDEEKNPNFIKVKDKLQLEGVKLWGPPYVLSNGRRNINKLRSLAEYFGEDLLIPDGKCFQLLEKLQTKARKNVRDFNRYLSTGQAAIKVKVFYEAGETLITIPISLTKNGSDLKARICKQASIIPHRLRMIFRGQLIHDESILQDMNIKHGLHVMGIGLKPSCEALSPHWGSDDLEVQDIKDIVILSKKGYFQGQEHFKILTEMPIKERTVLIRGLRFHKIGRASMKKGDYASGLPMLLEAEEYFRHFERSELETFGNYIVLNLDILWCYMNLQCLVLLPDAQERLDQCEEDFKKAYGKNLERINTGTDLGWTTLILLVRLHLLQVAVLYHRGKTFKARMLLKRTEKELRSLKVNNRQLSYLVHLGYRRSESQFALRETKGDVNKAIAKMDKKRLEMTSKLFRLVKKGQYLLKAEKFTSSAHRELALYKSLISLGCSEEVCKWVLEQRKYVIPNDDDEEEKSVNSGDQTNAKAHGIFLKTIITIGFQPKSAKAALKKHAGDFDEALKELFRNEFTLGYQSFVEIDSDSNAEKSGVNTTRQVVNRSCTFSFEHRQPMFYSQIFPEKTDNVPYDYIDNNLTLEIKTLQKYKGLLKKIKEERNKE